MGFRIIVRLCKYYTDERSLSYIYVNETFKFVHHLESYLLDLFNLEGPFCLMKDNHLLPSCENVKILQADESISVIPLTSTFDFFSKKSKATDETESVAEKDTKKKKRRKNKEVSEENSIEKEEPVKTPVKKSSNKENVATSSPCHSNTIPKKSKVVENMDESNIVEKLKDFQEQISPAIEEDELETVKFKALSILKDHIQANINGVSDGRITKRKRIRIRKNKKNSQVDLAALSDGEATTSASSTLYHSVNGKRNSHIRFSAPSEKAVTIVQNPKTANQFDDKPRIIKALHLTAQIIQESSKPFVLHQTTEVKEAEKDNASLENHSEMSTFNIISILKNIDKYPISNEILPVENDILLFKMLKMDENYSPTVSGHILGKVVNTGDGTDMLRLTILDGAEECQTPIANGKFEVEENTQTGVQAEIDVSLSQMLERRLIKSTNQF